MLPCHCEAGPYAAYGSGNHRRHIHRLLAVPKEGLCAAILVNCYIVTFCYDNSLMSPRYIEQYFGHRRCGIFHIL